jgi:hypothetical protein
LRTCFDTNAIFRTEITRVIAAAIIIVFLIELGVVGNGSARLLSIKYPDKNANIPAGSLIAASGTSAPSNSTHTNCNVGVKINQGKYIQATPQGPNGAGDYTKWTAITTTPTKLGLNEVEAQLLCYPPGNLSTPNLVKHLTRNVTGVQVVGGPGTSTAGPSSSIPSTLGSPNPSSAAKNSTRGQGPHSIIPTH